MTVRQTGDFRQQPLVRPKTPSPARIDDYRVFSDRGPASNRLPKRRDRFRPKAVTFRRYGTFEAVAPTMRYRFCNGTRGGEGGNISTGRHKS